MLNRMIPYPSLLVHKTSRGVAGYEGTCGGYYCEVGMFAKRGTGYVCHQDGGSVGYMLDEHVIRGWQVHMMDLSRPVQNAPHVWYRS